MLARRLVAAERSGHRSEMAGDSGMASVGDSVSTEALVSTEGSGLVAVSDSAGAGDVGLALDGVGVLASVGDGILGGDGATRTIHTRIGEVTAGTGTMTPGLTVQT
jgi:hypothetical protein